MYDIHQFVVDVLGHNMNSVKYKLHTNELEIECNLSGVRVNIYINTITWKYGELSKLLQKVKNSNDFKVVYSI